ncbi:hypothetical protein C8Q78DRAFT_1079218 [Trametes maxima]|nr:hypothetical protein C8Q78DRAFT_1079218 [Trametes maxima]
MSTALPTIPGSASPPSLDNSFGAWLLGTFFGLLMQGMIYHQAYRYFRLYPEDPALLKVWVVIVVYAYLVTNYFNPEVLLGPPIWFVPDQDFGVVPFSDDIALRSMASLPILGSFAAVVSQSFFARRVYKFGPRYRIIVAIAMLCYLAFFGFYTTLSIKIFHVEDFQGFLKFSWMASVGSSPMMVGDFLTTAVLIYALRRSRTGIVRTDSLLDLLIIYAVSTGLLICIFNVLNVAFAIALPDNLIYTATSIMLTKLYANTFLVALNTRHSLGDRGAVTGDLHFSTSRTTVLHGLKTAQIRHAHIPQLPLVAAGPPQSTALELKRMTTSDFMEPSRSTKEEDNESKHYELGPENRVMNDAVERARK